MELSPSEQSVMASFRDPDQARRAARALERAGLGPARVDRISLYPDETSGLPPRPLPGRMESLASAVLGSAGGDTGAALAAHPSASGLAGGPRARLRPYVVTAVVPRRRADEAARILREHGGAV